MILNMRINPLFLNNNKKINKCQKHKYTVQQHGEMEMPKRLHLIFVFIIEQ